MKLRVLYFASLKDRAGGSEDEVELPAGSDVGALWSLLVREHPGLGELARRPAVACDMAYAGWDTRLDGVSEVAFLPPVSGG